MGRAGLESRRLLAALLKTGRLAVRILETADTRIGCGCCLCCPQFISDVIRPMIIEPLFDQMVQVRPAAAYSCNPDGESLLLAAAIPMENPYCSCKLTRSGRTEPLRRGAPACGHHALARDAGESRPTAAIPMDNPYCSCKLTRVRSRCRRTSTSSTSPPRTWTRSSASSPPRSSRGAVAMHASVSTACCDRIWTVLRLVRPHARPEDPACCDQTWTVLQLVGPNHLGLCSATSCTPRRPRLL